MITDSHKSRFHSVVEYLNGVPEDKRTVLERLRTIIKQCVPEVEETISYQMPAYKYHGILVYFAAWKNHWGLYPASSETMAFFKDELAGYKQSKGAIQFPWDRSLPEALIVSIVGKRVEENRGRQWENKQRRRRN